MKYYIDVSIISEDIAMGKTSQDILCTYILCSSFILILVKTKNLRN